MVGAAFIGWLIYVAYVGYETHQQRGRLEFALKETPGIVVTDLDRVKGLWVAKGMADPLAFDVTKIAQSAKLSQEQLRLEFLPYVSLDPQLVLRRARAALDAPASVELRLNDGALVATGLANEAWVTRLKNTNATMLNVDRVDASKLSIDYSVPLKQISDQLSATKIYFADHLQLTNNAEAQLLVVAGLISRADKMAAMHGQRAQIILTGQTDASGPLAINDVLKPQRAELVKTRLIALGVPERAITIQQNQDIAATRDSSNRRVDFKIEFVAKTPT